MKVNFQNSLFLFCLMIAGSVVAGEDFEKSLQVSVDGKVYIDNDRGEVKVEGWDKAEVKVSGELANSAHELIFKNKGKKTLIKVTMKRGGHRGHKAHSQGNYLTVFLPKEKKLHFKGRDTDFQISGLNAGIQGNTVNGDLHVKDVHSRINISTISGDIVVDKSSGTAYVESMKGDIDFVGTFEDVHLQSVAGDIWADIAEVEKLKSKNVTGSTLVVGDLMSEAYVKLTSVNGDINYKVANKLNAECEIATRFGGEITNNISEDMPKSSILQQKKLKMVSGDGSATLVMNSISGRVTIDK